MPTVAPTVLPRELQKPPELTYAEFGAAKLTPRIPELLSPAGDWDAMRAAVANGADAVFFGLDNFNARHRATNFRLDELPQIVKYLHDHNVKGFLTLNTLLFSDELSEVQTYIRQVAASGIDAVIVQDLGLCRLIRALAPSLHLHASTQMTLTEPRGVEWVARLGVTRAVLARELSLDDIRKTALGLAQRQTETGLPLPELEVFVHGALCVSYSGQCLTSESLGGRSANRGQCAQACRLPYDLVVDGAVQDLSDKGGGAYLLSPQDLAAYDLIGDLAEIGVACLKIEGRLKSAHYVAATTQTYRAAIESAVEGRPFLIPAQQRADLEQTFSRGFTHGFLSGVNHQELVHARFPKSRGRRIGTVVATDRQFVRIQLDPALARDPASALKAGDGIVFDEGHPEQDEQGGRIYAIELPPAPKPINPAYAPRNPHTRPGPAPSPRASQIDVELMRGDANLAAVSPGAIVWKTDDPSLRKRLEHSFARDLVVKRIPLSAHVTAHVGSHLSLTLSDGPHSASAAWTDKPLEPAQKHPATDALLYEQLARLGDTPFDLASLTADLAGGPMIPKSVLNDLRRQCTEQLLKLRDTHRPHPLAEPDPLTRLRSEAAQLHPPTNVPLAPMSRGEGVPPSLEPQARPSPAPTAPPSTACVTGVPPVSPPLNTSPAAKAAAPELPPSPTPTAPLAPVSRGEGVSPSLEPQARPSPTPTTPPAAEAAAPGSPPTLPSLHVLVRDLPQLDAVLAWRAASPDNAALLAGVYADFEDVRRYKDAVTKCRAAGVSITLATVRVIKPREEGFTRFILDLAPDALLVRNLTSLAVAKDLAPAMPLIGDYSLNVSNELTAALFAQEGVARMVPSYDLSWKQLGAMLRRFDPGYFECVVHQHMPMFHMEHCVFSHLLSDGTDYRTCGRPCEAHRVELRDRQGQPHPLLADVGCRNTVFNAAAQSALEYIPDMLALNVRHFRLELLRESPEETLPLLNKYAAVLTGKADAKQTIRSLKVLNQLGVVGVTRGTLDRE